MAQTFQTFQTFDLGLLVAALAFGLRHGIDWDHIAAITDITASQDSPRAGVRLGTLYALGHAAVVLVLGVVAIVIGDRLPPAVDKAMGKVVGVTLVGLGVYVTYSLVRHGREFRMQSRWMLALRGVRAAYRWVRTQNRSVPARSVDHDHPHVAVGGYHHDHEVEDPAKPSTRFRGPTHRHRHRHPTDPLASYSTMTALGIGALHGIGAETPTQVLIFLAAAGAGGPGAGLLVLAVFLIGLVASNSMLTFGSAFGFLAASRRFAVYASVAAVTAVTSLAIGTLLLLGQDAVLPALLGG